MNIHSWGIGIQNSIGQAVAEFEIKLVRDALEIGPFGATSPPIGHQLLIDTGALVMSEHERVFHFKASELGEHFPPRAGDTIVDVAAQDQWRVVYSPDGNAWNWAGQTRERVSIFCKRDGELEPPPVVGGAYDNSYDNSFDIGS